MPAEKGWVSQVVAVVLCGVLVSTAKCLIVTPNTASSHAVLFGFICLFDELIMPPFVRHKIAAGVLFFPLFSCGI